MSSQGGPTANFSLAASQQHFRLLELPAELVDSLCSTNPPKLQFKSLAVFDQRKAPEAVLCTPDKTYYVRQQQTSNSVYVTAPSSLVNSSNELPQLGVNAISKCTSSLEIAPAPLHAAKSSMKDRLALFTEPEDSQRVLFDCHDRTALFANTPMSHGECHQAWSDYVAFELAASGSLPARCFRPTAGVMLKAWDWLRESALASAEPVDLTKSISSNLRQDVFLSDDDGEWPTPLREAILTRLALPSEAAEDLEERSLDRSRTVQWTGITVLQARYELSTDSSRMKKDAFIGQWKDALPEEWRNDTKIDSLPSGPYRLSLTGDYIEYVPDGAASTESKTATKPGAAGAGNKRKWHEKFAQARKQGKAT